MGEAHPLIHTTTDQTEATRVSAPFQKSKKSKRFSRLPCTFVIATILATVNKLITLLGNPLLASERRCISARKKRWPEIHWGTEYTCGSNSTNCSCCRRPMKRKGEPATCLMRSSTAMSLPRPTAGQPKATFAVEVTLSTIYILLILSDHPIHIGQAE